MNKKYEALFSPLKIGRIEIRNRFISEPMEGTNIIDWLMHCKFEEKVHDYYIERAKNEVGLIIPGMITLKSIIGNKWLHEHPEVFEPVKPFMEELHSIEQKFSFRLVPDGEDPLSFPMK